MSRAAKAGDENLETHIMMTEANIKLLEGAQYRVTVTLKDEQGRALDPALFRVYAGASCPGFAPAPCRATHTDAAWDITIPGLSAGRVPWCWQLMVCERATAVEWLVAAGDITVIPRHAAGAGYLDPGELNLTATLDKETLNMTVTVGDSTAAVIVAAQHAAESAASAAHSASAAENSATTAEGHQNAAERAAERAEQQRRDAAASAAAASAAEQAAEQSKQSAAGNAASAATSEQAAARAAAAAKLSEDAAAETIRQGVQDAGQSAAAAAASAAAAKRSEDGAAAAVQGAVDAAAASAAAAKRSEVGAAAAVKDAVADAAASAEAAARSAEAAAENVTLSVKQQEQLNYLIRNYGPAAQAPLPSPSENPGEEGNWEYLQDEDLTAYLSEQLMLKPDGTLPVYGVLLPWYQQTSTTVWTSTECEAQYLPEWCNGTPWLFDSLKADGTPKQWRPSTADAVGVDDYQGEHLWSWWNCNYVRCNNGNRRITAVEGMDTYREEGDVDVGVMYATRYCHFGMVELPWNGTTRKYTLVVMAGGTMADTRFPAAYKARLLEMGVTELKLFKECQRYSGEHYEVTAAPYGVHSKYLSVLGGTGTTGLKPRSQRGHLLTNVSHNNHVNGANVTDGATSKKGVTNYGSKGAGYFGGGMDRNLFIILHLMLKSGSKNTQKYMTGQVYALKDGVACQLGSTAAAQVFAPDSADPLIAPGRSVLVTRGAEAGFLVNDYVSVGGTGRDFGTTHQARGQIIGFYEHTHPETNMAYTEIVLDLQYGKTSFTYTTSHYITQQLPPTGTTDAIPGHYDGSAYNLTGSHATPCRVMGTEYAVGALQIFMDVVQEYVPGNLLQVYYANPQTPRQIETAAIRANYTTLGTCGKSGNYYAADMTADMETGTYLQTAPVSGSGSSATGLCDQTTKETSAQSGMRAYWANGGVFWFTGASAGLLSVFVGNGGYNAVLTYGGWYTASCD